MKIKTVYASCLALIFGLSLALPLATQAGGNTGQMVAKFEFAKSTEQVEQLKTGDTAVKVCRACKTVTLVRIEKGGKGQYDIVAKKCEDCGSEDTYVAISKQVVPFKEQIKR